MEVIFFKKPKNPVIIEGFPGFGLIGTISTEFLIDHLKTELIGKIIIDKLPAMVAIHEGKVVEPLGIFYSKKYNIVITHVVTAATGLEWPIAEAVLKIAEELDAKEIISLEGVGNPMAKDDENVKTYFFSSDETKRKKIKKQGCEPLNEGIVMGATAVLLINSHFPITCFFAETHSTLPDSKASAKIIEELDKYLDLKVDPKPLLDTAEQFEEKLKKIMLQSQNASEEQEKKRLSYVG